jgi:hypothetical protein
LFAQIPDDRAQVALAAKRLEQIRQPFLHLSVWIHLPLPIRAAQVANGQRKDELALARFVPAAFM